MDNNLWAIKLSTLNKRIEGFCQGYRQNVALLGNDTEEISYLLENYLQLSSLKNITYLYASTSYAGKKEFFQAVAFSLLASHTHKNESLDNLINYACINLPVTADFVKHCLKKQNILFLDVLELINKFINESGTRCILIIENFLGLANLFKNFYQDFSRFIILQRNCMIILTEHYCKDVEKVLAGELNLLFGNFEKVFVNENASLDNFLYLKKLLGPISPSPFFLSFFINIIGSNIIYYDLMAKAIKNNYNALNEEGSIASTIEETLYSKETYFFQRFIKQIDLLKCYFKDPSSAIKLLFSLSQGYMRKHELASLALYDSKALNSNLQKLLDLNYIENLGNIYKIKSPLFSFWLLIVFKLYFSPQILSPRQRKSLYRAKIEEEIALFKDEFFKDKLKKMLRLFSSFKNDSLRLGKDRYKLPSVENVKILSYPEKDFHLLVGEGKDIIFVGIKEKNTEDADIFEFIEKASNVKGTRVKKIFVSLGKLPSTARLIAKNNKLMIWDINEVNRLLSVYNNPIVPCEVT